VNYIWFQTKIFTQDNKEVLEFEIHVQFQFQWILQTNIHLF